MFWKKRALDFPSSSSSRQKSCLSSNRQRKYDVFLNFRGEDTRDNFTDHLYAALKHKGIITFRDDEGLERGREIASELFGSIESSRFSIIILSKNYASSKWCLEELAKIIECKDTKVPNVFPVFYKVDPSDIRNQRGDFKTVFDKHEKDFKDNPEKVQRWRSALKQVCNLSGWRLKDGRSEVELITSIVDTIWERLNINSNVAEDFVGIEPGIWRTGGVGKVNSAKDSKNKRNRKVNSAKDSKNKRNSTAAGNFISNDPNLIVFNLTDIEVATDNLSIENMIGQGGYGPVYKGVLPDGLEIAVKKLSKSSKQGFEQFKNEVMLTTKLQHINIVRVLGFCIDREEQMLVYEYMPNKSLDYYLFDPNRYLDWKKRIDIIEGVTQGLLYLQEYSRLTIIHRDVKASNILLDENMKPKISDFALARIFKKYELEAYTTRICGTLGYISPEYDMYGIYSTKSDVYSFGVLLLQIISGKKVYELYGENESISLIHYAYKLWKDDKGMDFMDPSLEDTFSSCKLMTCLQIALLCVQETPNDRPTMIEVFSMLKNEATCITIPKKPGFSRLTDENEQNQSAMHLEVCSVSDATISEL